ncbi:MAG: Gfo/Idh/MocA family oxidoreductase [Deltaproteobacteria bacterium]|nr:Gfo/Idh/MocA family oxidoreductase [Deltaproteobacteria bacterium]
MTTTKPIGVGVIGAGASAWASLAHLPALAALPAYRLVAVSTTRQASADETARRFGVPHAFAGADALIAHPEVELVVVSVRAPAHAPLVRAALAAGKHVFCEWPVGATTEHTVELAELAARAGVHTFTGLHRRFAPSVVHLRSLLAGGYLGTLRSIHVHGAIPLLGARRPSAYAYTADLANGANALHTLTPHLLDTALSVVGEPTSLSALVTRQFDSTTIEETGETVPVTAPDQIAVIGTLPGGAVLSARIEAGKGSAHLGWTLTGTDGDLEVGPDLSLRGARAGGGPLAPIEVPATAAPVPRGTLGDDAHQVAQLYAAIAVALRGGAADPLVPTFREAARIRRFLDALLESSRTGRRIEWQP